MADDTAKKDYEKLDAEYMEGPKRSLEQFGSVIMTSSKFLNSARLRDIYAQEGLRRNGHDVPPTYMVHQAAKALGELTEESTLDALILKEKQAKPDFARWLDARRLSDFALDELAGFAPETLGGRIHEYLSRTGFDLNLTNRGLQPTTDYRFLLKQRTVSHDIEHLITGLSPNPIGEQALIACNLKAYYNYFSPELACELTRMSGFLLSTGSMKINLHYPVVMGEFLTGVQIGVAMGDGLKHPLLLNDWRSYLDRTIDDIRRELNVTNSPPPGTWDWTNEARRG